MGENTLACSSSSRDICYEEREEDLGFVIDSSPAGRSIPIPDYECKGNYKLVGDSVKELNELQSKLKGRRPGGNNVCWNCSNTGHSNRDCPLPTNPRNLARNRQQFLSKRATRNGVRYHMDNEQRFDRFQPGLISNSLRRALGLHSNQMPRHIYNMRHLGYPPGWLEEAKVLHSGITLFDAKGKAVEDPDDEEGEVVENVDQRNKYDISKLIKYPGFNTPLPNNINEEYESGNFSPMRSDHSLDNLIAILRPNEAKAYRWRKVPVIPSVSPPREEETTQDSTEADMECEETPDVGFLPDDGCAFVPALPDDPHPAPPPPPPAPNDVPSMEDGECSNQSVEGDSAQQSAECGKKSPTLGTLEEQKKSILQELDDSSNAADMKSPITERVKLSKSVSNTPSPNLGRTKSVDLGTPILKSVSPFSKLPSSEAFSKNICDVINFENLPDYTGVYDKMLGVIGKVRSKLKKLHSDD